MPAVDHHTPDEPLATYQALNLGGDQVTHCTPRDTLQEAQSDADQVPGADAQVMRLRPSHRVAASRDAGQS